MRTSSARLEVDLESALQETFSSIMTVRGFFFGESMIVFRNRALAIATEMGGWLPFHF